jgi:hypothetical protein
MVISAQAFEPTSAIKTPAARREKNKKLGGFLRPEGGILERRSPTGGGKLGCVSGGFSAGAIDIAG